MAFLPRPVTMTMFGTPEATASSTPYWIVGLSTSGSISFGCAFVAGRKRVPRPAAGKTALRIFTLTPIEYARHCSNGAIPMLDPAYVRDNLEAVQRGLSS